MPHFTTERYVDQRLALAKVSPNLHEVYAENGVTLAQLEAFTAYPTTNVRNWSGDAIRQSHYREPWRIWNMLTEPSVAASDWDSVSADEVRRRIFFRHKHQIARAALYIGEIDYVARMLGRH